MRTLAFAFASAALLTACVEIADAPTAVAVGGSPRLAVSTAPIPVSAPSCIARTRAAVVSLAGTGAINGGQRNAFEQKLDAILNHLENDNVQPTWNGVDAYNNAVAALLRSGRITAAQADDIHLELDCATPVAVAAGLAHTCVLLANGDVWCWGDNAFGQLGNGTTTASLVPVQSAVVGATQLDAGFRNTCVLDAGGLPHCWGPNASGQLGNGTTAPSLVPTPVSWPTSTSPVQLTVGWSSACGRLATGVTYCWGDNREGQLGTGSSVDTCGTLPCSTTPIAIPSFAFADMDIGVAGGCGIDFGSAAYCWGERVWGAIGDGAPTTTGCIVNGMPRATCVATPTAVTGGHQFRAISFGAQYACGIRTDGNSMCWGVNVTGQLGAGLSPAFPSLIATRNFPVLVLGGVQFAGGIAADDENAILAHNCGMSGAGAAYCWGWNDDGQLGVPAAPSVCPFGLLAATCALTPMAVSGGHQFKQMSLGERHTCGITVGNDVLCWGRNVNGQLGDGTTTQRVAPTQVLTPWAAP